MTSAETVTIANKIDPSENRVKFGSPSTLPPPAVLGGFGYHGSPTVDPWRLWRANARHDRLGRYGAI